MHYLINMSTLSKFGVACTSIEKESQKKPGRLGKHIQPDSVLMFLGFLINTEIQPPSPKKHRLVNAKVTGKTN